MHRARLRRAAEAICRRCGLHACYNAKFRNVMFHHGDQFGGPFTLAAFHPDGNEKVWGDVDIDNAVEFIQRGYIPRDQKDRIAARNTWLEECERKNAVQQHTQNRAPEAKSRLGFNDRKRRGVQKVISV